MNDHEYAIAQLQSHGWKKINLENRRQTGGNLLLRQAPVNLRQSWRAISVTDPFIGHIQKDTIYYAKSLIEKTGQFNRHPEWYRCSFYYFWTDRSESAYFIREKTAEVVQAYLNKT